MAALEKKVKDAEEKHSLLLVGSDKALNDHKKKLNEERSESEKKYKELEDRQMSKLDASGKEIEERESKNRKEKESLAKKLRDLEEKMEIEVKSKDQETKEAEKKSKSEIEDLRKQLDEIIESKKKLESQLKESNESSKGLEERIKELETQSIASSKEAEERESKFKSESEKLGKADNKELFDKAFIDELSSQHELDLSSARSQIRKLEASVFEQTDSAQKSERRALELENALAIARSAASDPSLTTTTAPTPNIQLPSLNNPSTSGSGLAAARAHRRSVTSAHVPSLSPLSEKHDQFDFKQHQPGAISQMLTPSSIGQISPTNSRRGIRTATPEESNLPPAQRHRRRESLQMLRARIGQDLGIPEIEKKGQLVREEKLPTSTIASPSFEKSQLQSLDQSKEEGESRDEKEQHSHGNVEVQVRTPSTATLRRPQFSQEDILCCSACRNDLIIV